MIQLLSVSVIMPAYNEEATIGDQLAALARQELVRSLEIIVADNGSEVDPLRWTPDSVARPKEGAHVGAAEGATWPRAIHRSDVRQSYNSLSLLGKERYNLWLTA